MSIEVASINAPDRPRASLPPVEAAEADRTFYVKSGKVAMLTRILTIVLQNPGTALRGLRAALRLGDWDLLRRAYALFYLAEALLVGDWMRRRSLTHLHVHFGGAVATVGMLTSQTWKVPWSVTLHGPDEFFDQDAFYLKQKIESASFVICISDFCRSQVLRIAPALAFDRLEVVRLGVDCSRLKPAPTPLNRGGQDAQDPKRPFRLVCTGRLVAAKGHGILLESLAPLVRAGAQIECILVGDGPERRNLEAQAVRLGLSTTVRFLGAMAHQPALDQVAQGDVFVLASFAEGLPVALMEAMALGVPCISTTIAAIPEMIHDAQNGLLVAPSNSQALTAALARLMEDGALRSSIRENARKTAELEYNLAQNLDILAAVWLRRMTSDHE